VKQDQAIYYFNENNDKGFVFTLLPNGNIQVEEFGVDYGFEGEYTFGGHG